MLFLQTVELLKGLQIAPAPSNELGHCLCIPLMAVDLKDLADVKPWAKKVQVQNFNFLYSFSAA